MHLVVAMPDPTNLYVIDTLQFLTECWIKPTMASAESIIKAIGLQYGAASSRRARFGHPAPPSPIPDRPALDPTDEEWQPPELIIKRLEERCEKLVRILLEHGSTSQVKALIDLL
jgi:hypothetical protein